MLERKTLYKGGFLELKSIEDRDLGMPPFEYITNYKNSGQAVAILPYRHKEGKIEFLLRKELNPAWDPTQNSVTSITGGVEDSDHRLTALRELKEEAGYEVRVYRLIYLDSCRTSKASEVVTHLYGVCLTDMPQTHTPEGDGSYFEKVSTCEWMPYEDLLTSQDSLLHIMYLRLLHEPKFKDENLGRRASNS